MSLLQKNPKTRQVSQILEILKVVFCWQLLSFFTIELPTWSDGVNLILIV